MNISILGQTFYVILSTTMSKRIYFVILGLSLFLNLSKASAAPLTTAPPIDPSQESDAQPPRPLDDNLSVAKPLPLAPPPPLKAYYYAYSEALTFRAGFADAPGQSPWSDQVLGFEYVFPKFLSPKLEAGADLHSNGVGHIHAGARWFYRDRDFFRPSVELALDNLINSADGLATFGDINNYYLRFGATLEYVVWDPFSIRLEVEYFANFQSANREVTLGVSRGW